MTDSQQTGLLGPFIGYVTDTTARIWLHLCALQADAPRSIKITLHETATTGEILHAALMSLTYENLAAGVVRFEDLMPDTEYFYRIAEHDGQPLDLEGLQPEDLHFRTLPAQGYRHQLDFLLMSCNNPETARNDGCDGFAVWAAIPNIIAQNKNVRFALLIGDQVYGDDIEKECLAEADARKRQELYLTIYRRFWSHPAYRKVLCSLPAVMMWDDHDITDGWGSREDSFTTEQPDEFQPAWLGLFRSARNVFEHMQAKRNPTPLAAAGAFDFCFRIGRAAFVVPDLRSNRNVRKRQIWRPEQLTAIQQWVREHRCEIDTLFFATSVVFSHGNPGLDSFLVKNWLWVLKLVAWMLKKWNRFKKHIEDFQTNVGDLRDDLNDSWGAEVNAEQTDRVLDWLFGLQNPPVGTTPINVVILSGDIHTPGYSTIYSLDPGHARPIIPHVVATPVAYKPFSWMLEALYRHLTKVVTLGAKGNYTAQVSHHYCHRNVAVISLRQYGDTGSHLKVKFYLEGFPEPETVLFDLNAGSHREAIAWRSSTPNATKAPVSA